MPLTKSVVADPIISKIATDLAALTVLVKQQATMLHMQGSVIQGVKLQQTSDIQECRNMFSTIMGMAASASSGSANQPIAPTVPGDDTRSQKRKVEGGTETVFTSPNGSPVSTPR